jgi:hypothetical protein
METQAYFTNIKSHISTELKSAATSIYVAVAWFTDPKLLSILCDKAKAGLDVQLIVMDDDTTKRYGLNYTVLENCGGRVYMIDGDTTSVTMHNKFCVIDGKTTITGSYNWSNRAQSNHENITITKDSELLAESFVDEFRRIKVLYHGKDALKRFDAEVVCKRLLIIDNLIQLEEYDQISLHQTKINEYELTVEVVAIMSVLEASDYVSTSTGIREYLVKIKALAKYTDKDLERLKWEIKYLETEILAIENEKTTIEKIIADFIHTYTLAFGDLLSKILSLKKERLQREGNQRSREFEEAEKEFKDFKEQYKQEKKKEFYDLTDDEKEELKKKYRKAATLCHPDRFTDDEMKAKAHIVFVELQAAYAKNDLERVCEILDKLERGIYDIEQRGTSNKREELLDRINYLRNRLNEITKDVNELLISKSYKDIITIKNMETFFEEEKERLEKELNNLEK